MRSVKDRAKPGSSEKKKQRTALRIVRSCAVATGTYCIAFYSCGRAETVERIFLAGAGHSRTNYSEWEYRERENVRSVHVLCMYHTVHKLLIISFLWQIDSRYRRSNFGERDRLLGFGVTMTTSSEGHGGLKIQLWGRLALEVSRKRCVSIVLYFASLRCPMFAIHFRYKYKGFGQ